MTTTTTTTATTTPVKRAAMTPEECALILAGYNDGSDYAKPLTIEAPTIGGRIILTLRPTVMLARHNLETSPVPEVKGADGTTTPATKGARTERAQSAWYCEVSADYGIDTAPSGTGKADTFAAAIKASGDWEYLGNDLGKVSAYHRVQLVSYGSTSVRRNIGDSLRSVLIAAGTTPEVTDSIVGAIKGEPVKRAGGISAQTVASKVEAAVSAEKERSIATIMLALDCSRDVAVRVANGEKYAAILAGNKSGGKPATTGGRK